MFNLYEKGLPFWKQKLLSCFGSETKPSICWGQKIMSHTHLLGSSTKGISTEIRMSVVGSNPLFLKTLFLVTSVTSPILSHCPHNGWPNPFLIFVYPMKSAQISITLWWTNHSNGKSPFFMGKSTISMAIFNSKLLVHQRVLPLLEFPCPIHPEDATRWCPQRSSFFLVFKHHYPLVMSSHSYWTWPLK